MQDLRLTLVMGMKLQKRCKKRKTLFCKRQNLKILHLDLNESSNIVGFERSFFPFSVRFVVHVDF